MGGDPEPAALALACERICGRLQRRMVALVGREGFAALFTRALYLAGVAYPGLAGIALDERAPHGLQGVREYAATHESAEVGAALATILAEFAGLLTIFIGEELSMRLIGEVWPVAGDDAGRTPDGEAQR